MREEEITYKIRKYNVAKMFRTLEKEYPVIGNIKNLDINNVLPPIT